MPTRSSGGMLPQEKFLNLDPLRFLLTQSGTKLFNTCDKTILTILNFKRFLGGGGIPGPNPPPWSQLGNASLVD